MCEIFLLYSLGKMIAEQAKAKGLTAFPYVMLLIVLWIGGEVFGFLTGAVLMEGEDGLLPFALALFGAVTGAAVSFGVVSLAPSPEAKRQRFLAENDAEYDDYAAAFQERIRRQRPAGD